MSANLMDRGPGGRPKLHPDRKRSVQLIVLVSKVEMQYIDRLRKQRSRSSWGHDAVLNHIKEASRARDKAS